MYEVALDVEGRRLFGWKKIAIDRSLGAFCGRFSLGLLDSWDTFSRSWFVKPFAKCQVLIDDEIVLTGYVDSLEVGKSSSGTSITAAGRDLTSDLVDCFAVLQNYEFKDITLSSLVRKLLDGFGVEYVEDADPGKAFALVQVNQGVRISSVLETYAKYRGLLFLTDAQGRLVLVEPSSYSSEVSLVEGQNVKSYSIKYDTQNRYSDYTIESQSSGLAGFFGSIANQIEQSAEDLGVPRYRPYGAIADKSATAEDGKKLAEWEASVRAAKGQKLMAEVVGWRQGPAKTDALWRVNSKVYVKLPSVGVDGEFLVSSVRFSLDRDGGAITMLGIERPDAYQPKPSIEPGTDPFSIFTTASGAV